MIYTKLAKNNFFLNYHSLNYLRLKNYTFLLVIIEMTRLISAVHNLTISSEVKLN